MKIILTAAITAAICFAITAATGFASRNDNAYFHTMKPGDTAWFPKLDLTCEYGDTGGASNRPDRTQTPREVYCSTYSHATAGMRITKRSYIVNHYGKALATFDRETP
jgi:hypothetical protein